LILPSLSIFIPRNSTLIHSFFPMQLLTGFLLGIAIAALAWRAGALSGSGAWAAALTGGLIFGLGGLPWAALLLTFFITSSLLSRLFGRRKSILNEKFSKGSQRDWGQVFANGGLGALLAIVQPKLPGQVWPWVAFCGAMAAVNADTWATEIGVLSHTRPRLINTWEPVDSGTSGGVSLLGYGAVLAGSALVGIVAALFSPQGQALAALTASLLGGLAGATFDSFLGATVQSIYYCPTCQKETERHPMHTCGTETQPLRGWRWLSNDWVNFACSLMGATAAVAVGWVLF
jgi:uncharacterized protein (TIGR00297 family)